jgi:hypothetical protein
MAMLELDMRPIIALGDEPHLDFRLQGRVMLPVAADIPRQNEPRVGFPQKHSAPVTMMVGVTIAGVPWLFAIGLVKLTLLESVGLIAGGATPHCLAKRSEDRAKLFTRFVRTDPRLALSNVTRTRSCAAR